MSIKRGDFLFTKGPWKVMNENGCKEICHKVGTNKQAQYRGLCLTVGLCADDNAEVEDLANARLIAASPEMLYAIDETLRLFPTGNMGPEEFAAFEELKRVHNLARMGRESSTA